VLGRGQGPPAPFPCPNPFCASGILPSLRFGRFLSRRSQTLSSAIEKPNVARTDGVRDHPGMPFGFPPERAFSFAGLLAEVHSLSDDDISKVFGYHAAGVLSRLEAKSKVVGMPR